MARGKPISLSSLADEPSQGSVLPKVAVQVQTSAPIEQVAANPLNTREIDPAADEIRDIADSIRAHGQLQPCAVVTRAAFLRIFPEHEATVGTATFVQVTGGRRRFALPLAGKTTMDIRVHDNLAESRLLFLSATAAENIDRQDYNAVEEARAVAHLVHEAGEYQAAADKLRRTKAWITQRMNLLKLAPEIQDKIKANQVALRDVRTLHQHPASRQMAVLEQLLTAKARATEEQPAKVAADQAKVPEPRTPASAAANAVRKLGGTPPRIADALRAVLSHEDLRALAELLSEPAEETISR
jgi:ParB family chromosome partitioning protein